MIYKIVRPTSKEWNEKRFVEAYLTPIDATEGSHPEEFKVSAWANEFNNPDGSFKTSIETTLEKNDKGYWKLTSPKAAAGANYKTAQTEKLMDKKTDSIARFQDSKETSIKISSVNNKAVELAVSEYANPNSLDKLEILIEKWRKYLWENWDNWQEYPPFKS